MMPSYSWGPFVLQDLDAGVVFSTAGSPQGASLAASLAIDEQQVNALLLDVV